MPFPVIYNLKELVQNWQLLPGNGSWALPLLGMGFVLPQVRPALKVPSTILFLESHCLCNSYNYFKMNNNSSSDLTEFLTVTMFIVYSGLFWDKWCILMLQICQQTLSRPDNRFPIGHMLTQMSEDVLLNVPSVLLQNELINSLLIGHILSDERGCLLQTLDPSN